MTTEASKTPEFPGYELERQLGAGGMGEVWLARDLALDRRVALKVLRHELLDDRTAQERFRREAKTVARLRHSGIIKIFAVGEHENRGFFSMEYIDGLSLKERIQQDGFLALDLGLDILEQVASAIDAAHLEKVVHRDIKPSNILIDSLDRVTVTDFGLARIQELPTLTDSNVVLGTPGYLAPESIQNSQGSISADIYSFGVTAYECLTGRKPYWNDQLQLMEAHEVLGHIPKPISNLISRCLNHDHQERLNSLSEFIDGLRHFRNRVQESTVAAKQPIKTSTKSLWQQHQFLWMTSLTSFAIFMLVKSIYIDSALAIPNQHQELGPFSLETQHELRGELESLIQNSGLTSFSLAFFALGFSFWFCSLVECLASDDSKYKNIFSQNNHMEKGVWLGIFILLNLLGAILWKVVTHRSHQLK